MPIIDLEVSEEVSRVWQSFLKGQQAGSLTESGLLGDWVLLGFMGEVDRYLKQGGPASRPNAKKEAEIQAAKARKKLAKPQRRILPMFNENDQITVEEISRVLGMTPQQGRQMVDQWLEEGFLSSGPGRDGLPTYGLSVNWQRHNLAANRPSLNVPRSPFLLRNAQMPED